MAAQDTPAAGSGAKGQRDENTARTPDTGGPAARGIAEGSGSPPTDPSDERAWHDWLRWFLALAVAIAAAYYFLDATADKIVCTDVVGGPQNNPGILETCAPPRLLEIVPFGLVIALLLWPDLGEIGIAGAVTLKRRLDRQEERQTALEGQLVELHQALTQTATAMQGQSQAATTNVYYGYAPDQGDVRRGIDEKQRTATTPPGEPDTSVSNEERLRLLGTFLADYAKLEPYVMVGQLRRSPRWAAERLAHVTDDQQHLVDWWNEMFAAEIQATRRTRNVAVHEPETVSAETLRGAIDNTRELTRILFERLGL